MSADRAGPPYDYRVVGMTCAHCVASVTEELLELSGVTGVDVVLETGAVHLKATAPPDPAGVAAAVAEAGYALAEPER